MEWPQWCQHFLEALMGQDLSETHRPRLSGDRGERDREQALFEAETRHVQPSIRPADRQPVDEASRPAH